MVINAWEVGEPVLPKKLVLEFAVAVQRGAVTSCTPDIARFAASWSEKVQSNGRLRYAELPTKDRMLSLQLVLVMFLSKQKGRRASFTPYKWFRRYFVYHPNMDTWVLVRDLETLFSAIGKMEVNGRRWRPTGIRRVKAKNILVIDFAAR